jgi:heptosyltransferase-3
MDYSRVMQQIDRIIVIAPAQLGDVLICTPLIRATRARWPDARIHVLGFAGTLEPLRGNADVDELIEIARVGGLWAQLGQAWRMWRQYDLALVTRTTDRAHLYGFVTARARSVVLSDGGPGSVWKRRLAEHVVAVEPGRHQIMQNLRLLEPWAEPPKSVSMLPPAPVALPPQIEARIAHPCVVVHVPSMWRYKQWPTARFRSVVEALLAEGVQVILTGSASATDQAQIADVRAAGAAPYLLDVSGRLSMPQVRTLLQRVDAYFGPDTSVTHMAAAVGVPIVTVFGPTNPQDFGPWPNQHVPLQPWRSRAARQQVDNIVLLQGPDLPDRKCVPCNRMGCDDRHDSTSQCLLELAVPRVLAELHSILRRRADERRREARERAVSNAQGRSVSLG